MWAMIYSAGNFIEATAETPFLQIGETKYGKPILDRGCSFENTTLEAAAKYALLSLDSTMKSNVTVGPPIDLLVYGADELRLRRYRRFTAKDLDLREIHVQWEHALQKAVRELPEIQLGELEREVRPARERRAVLVHSP